MKSKIFFSLFFFLCFDSNLVACELLAKDFISLSGPVTHVLYQLGLLQDKHLQAISIFHGIPRSLYPGKQLPGGVFLSAQYLKSFAAPVVFFDESIDLEQSLNQAQIGQKWALKSRGLDPFTVYEKTKQLLAPYLLHCQQQWGKLDLRVQQIKTKLLGSPSLQRTYFFYLGEILTYDHPPEMLMVQDGPLLFWQQYNLIRTYPSSLAYVTWSQKILEQVIKTSAKNLPLMHIGLEMKAQGEEIYQVTIHPLGKEKHSTAFCGFNVQGPSLLIPGIAQIFFMEKVYPLLVQVDRFSCLPQSKQQQSRGRGR